MTAIPSTVKRHSFTTDDRDVLRRLAAEVAELAARPVEQEKRDLWYRHNALQSTRPVIFCDPENGWNEILPQSDLKCRSDLARAWEWHLRREIFWGREMQDDRVIEPFFTVSHTHTDTGWGLGHRQHGGDNGGSYVWDAPLDSYDRIAHLHFPEVSVDERATAETMELAEETFGDLLTVRLKSVWWWTLGLTQTLVFLRGLQQIMLDMVDNPEGLHRLMAFLRDGTMARVDFLERSGLLSLNNDGTYVGSGGFGWSRELPASDFAGTVRCKDMWGFCESQETVGVSPRMFAEFIFPYQLPILERFSLNCYGCCEPLDKRWHVIKQIPGLRRVSTSPWSDIKFMAEHLQDNYIISRKPNPSYLAMASLDEDAIRAELREEMDIMRQCRVEFIMKDCHTICNDPSRVTRWVRIAREEAERI